MSILRACLDWRVLAVLLGVGAGVAAFAPNLIAGAIPLLIVAACPLSMLVMMWTMGRHSSGPSPTPDRGSADSPSQLHERLAATRLEQQQIERELARLDSVDDLATADAKGTDGPAKVGARLS